MSKDFQNQKEQALSTEELFAFDEKAVSEEKFYEEVAETKYTEEESKELERYVSDNSELLRKYGFDEKYLGTLDVITLKNILDGALEVVSKHLKFQDIFLAVQDPTDPHPLSGFDLTPNADIYYANGTEGTINGLAGNDFIVGHTIFGASGTTYPNTIETINGGDGNDAIYGAGGNDILNGDDGDDVICGGTGNTTWVDGGDDTISGGIGNDNLNGEYGDDKLYGDAGDDYLLGGAGSDELDGGIGSDTIFGDVVNFGNGNDTINGGDGNDTIYGNAGNDTISGGTGDDIIRGDDYISTTVSFGGGNGNDIINGGTGNDTIYGDGGNDTIEGGVGADNINGGTGIDTAVYATSAAGVYINLGLATQANGEPGNDADGDIYAFVNGLSTIENVTGSAFADIINGDNQNNIFNGGNGNDQIWGGYAADIINGDAGNDTLFGGADDDTLDGGSGDDQLYGDDGDDALVGGDGDDVLSGGNYYSDLDDGYNTLDGGDGNDTLRGDVSIDYMDGGSGVDTADYSYIQFSGITVNLETNIHSGIAAEGDTLINIENIIGTSYVDTLIGNSLNNTLIGNYGDDILIGGAGNDTLKGGDGYDVFIGGAGADIIDGGSDSWIYGDNDTVDYSTSNAAVTVNLHTNLNTGGDAQGDSITKVENIKGSAFNDKLTGDNLVDIQNTIDGGAGNDIINGGGGGDILIGGAGADHIDGGGNYLGNNSWSIDFVDYTTSSAAVTINLYTNINTGGDAEGDIITNVQGVNGSMFDDNITVNDVTNISGYFVYGNDGNDTINGGSRSDWLYGGNGDDIIYGHDGFSSIYDYDVGNILIGGLGADYLNGGNSLNDNAAYWESAEGVVINLTTNNNTGGEAQGDFLVNVEHIIGSLFNDDITGNMARNNLSGNDGDDILDGAAGDDLLDGGRGADILDGGTGNDTAIYFQSQVGVTINLLTNINTGGDAEGDLLYNIENIIGSTHDDNLTGDDSDNIINFDYVGVGDDILNGMGGDDLLSGGSGADTIDGGDGSDTIEYSNSTGVIINLETYTASGGDAEGDIISNVENVIGSGYADTIIGNSADNILVGSYGADTLTGGEGADSFYFSLPNESYANHRDTITDFEHGVDKIVLSQFFVALDFSSLSIYTSGSDTIVDSLDTVFSLKLTGNNLNLDENDFIFV